MTGQLPGVRVVVDVEKRLWRRHGLVVLSGGAVHDRHQAVVEGEEELLGDVVLAAGVLQGEVEAVVVGHVAVAGPRVGG